VIANHEGQASSLLADRIADLLFVAGSPTDARKFEQVRTVLADLQRGTIDRSLLTPNLDAYFSAEALADFKAGLAPLGTPAEVTFVWQGVRGGLATRVYRASYEKCALKIISRSAADGRFESFWVSAE
jgi:D-alanyl-D-alanine carboxypeptidase